MRIVSLVPEATEILEALGLADDVTRLPADATASPEQLAAALQAAQPTLIFTSESAAGGGVPRPDVRRAVSRHRPRPGIYALEPHTLGDILSDIKTVGDATGHQRAARTLIEALRARIDAVTLRSARALEAAPPRRVAILASHEPLTAAGWWLTELIGLAGGMDVLGGLGRPPHVVTQEQIMAARPDLVLWADEIWDALTPALSQREREQERPLPLGEGWGEGVPVAPHPGPNTVTLLEHLAERLLS